MNSIHKRTLLAVLSTAIGVLAACAIWWTWNSENHQEQVPNNLHFGSLEPDDIVGVRPRKSAILNGLMGPLHGTNIPITRHQNNLGLIRNTDLRGQLSGPRILLHGDSHIMGIVNTADNVSSILEAKLRKNPSTSKALVLNAACHDYTFYQYVLRHRTLSAQLQPKVIVVVAYMGNDFLGLEDTRRPYIDDQGREQLADPNPPAETTTTRIKALGLDEPGPLSGLFWQALNQALYFQQHPQRVPVVKQKAIRVLQLLQAEAKKSKAQLVLAVLPSCDLVLPNAVGVLDKPAIRSVIKSGIQQQFYDWFLSTLQKHGIDHIDLLPLLRTNGQTELFANDLHIWVPAHQLIAEAMFKKLLPMLRTD
jgi:hypothetical protein